MNAPHRGVAETAAETPMDRRDGDTSQLSHAADDFGFAAGGPDPFLGTVFGDVTLVQLIAEGGMGRVYEGRQRIGFTEGSGALTEERPVAVKLIKSGSVSAGLLQRFDAEARLLARLDDQGIARIYGAGIHVFGGVRLPYMVMELIPDALPLVDYATHNHLPVRQKLALFREVCAAVAHGHLRGIIHRDLKPGNILVAGSGPLAGRPRVIDYGIALATDTESSQGSRQTRVGQLIGTLPYMSPEQVAGDIDQIDTRTDVYALGGVLYELLTGRLPHDVRRKSALEAARIIHEEDPLPLNVIDSRLSRELAAIAGKCLAKRPAARYSTAAELADDIERHLDGRPIQASPPGFFAGLVRLARRHRAAAAATLASLAAVLLAVVGIGIFAARAEQQRQVAERERTIATQASERANRRRAAAEELVRFMTFNLRDQFEQLGRLDLLAGVLDELSRYHESSKQLANDGLEQLVAEQRRQHEVFLNIRGDLERAAGRPAKARTAYEEALGVAQALAAEMPQSLELQRDLSVSHQKIGGLAAEGGDTEGARQHFLEARSLRERLVQLAPEDPNRLWDMAGIEDRLSELAMVTGDLNLAREHLASLQQIVGKLVARDPANSQWRWGLAGTLQKLGGLDRRGNDLDQSRAHLTASLVIMSELAPGNPTNREWQWGHALTAEKLGSVCLALGDISAAREHFATSFSIAERIFYGSDDSQGVLFRVNLLRSLAECHRRLGEEAKAEACETRIGELEAGSRQATPEPAG
jgi:eukaryotic-like serine/threonine-protein kinase